VSDSVTTKLDVPYGQQPETRAAARRVLARRGAADLFDILGLVDPEPAPRFADDGRRLCPNCGQPLPSDGRTSCRRAPCRKSRGGTQ
jgi:hypothetical protein